LKSRILKLFLIILFTVGFVNGQNFSVIIEHTELTGALGSEIIFEFRILNNSNTDLTLFFVRSVNTMPEGWSSSLCFERCFRDDIDSVVTNSQFGSSPIQPDSSCEFSLHVSPFENEGESQINIKIGNAENAAEIEEFVLTASTGVTSVKTKEGVINGFELLQNYPNPFNPSTQISFNIENPGLGTLEIFGVIGNSLFTIKEGYFRSGYHEIEYRPENISSGVYFYRLRINNLVQTKKMILGK